MLRFKQMSLFADLCARFAEMCACFALSLEQPIILEATTKNKRKQLDTYMFGRFVLKRYVNENCVTDQQMTKHVLHRELQEVAPLIRPDLNDNLAHVSLKRVEHPIKRSMTYWLFDLCVYLFMC